MNISNKALVVIKACTLVGCSSSHLDSNSNSYNNLYIEQEPIYSTEVPACNKEIDSSTFFDSNATQELIDWHVSSSGIEEPQCINNVGWVYDVVERSYEKAREWYGKASYLGDIDATYNMGLTFDNSSSVFGSYKDAFVFYQVAAIAGHKNAQNNLGQMYLRGHGVTRNPNKAKKWFKKSAEQGYPVAYVNMGFLYELGYGIAQDYKKARANYEEAAKLGESTGQFKLALLYEKGLGGAVDLEKAIELYESSASRGNSYAAYRLKNLSNE